MTTAPITIDDSAPPAPTLTVRKPELNFDDSIPHHWLAGNAFATQVFNGLNLVFPDGERFFIEAIRDCVNDSVSPALKKEIRAFNGQEGRHAFEHERYFEILERQGYEISGFLRFFNRFMRFSTRFLPAPVRLALTAGAEHYTAIFGSIAFENPLVADAHPEMQKLLLWHAAEEIEHKHVAFDVLQATHPSLWLRRLGYVLATIDLFGFTIFATRMLIKQDLAAGRTTPEQLQADKAEARRIEAVFLPRMRERMRAYWRRDFHPSETDERAQAYAKLDELGLA